MRDGHVGAEDSLVAAQLGHRAGKAGTAHISKHVAAIDAECFKGGVLHAQ